MPHRCHVCDHEQHAAIDAALLTRASGYRNIAQRFGVEHTALFRHAHSHLSAALQQAEEVRRMLNADNLTEQVGKWHARMEAQYAKADATDNIFGAATVARVGLAAVDSFARIAPMEARAADARSADAEAKARVEQQHFDFEVGIASQEAAKRGEPPIYFRTKNESDAYWRARLRGNSSREGGADD